jgi:hypothetical protein
MRRRTFLKGAAVAGAAAGIGFDMSQVRMEELPYPAHSGIPQKDVQLLRPSLPPETEGLEHHLSPRNIASQSAF